MELTAVIPVPVIDSTGMLWLHYVDLSFLKNTSTRESWTTGTSSPSAGLTRVTT